MRYQQLRKLYNNRNAVFSGYNSADGTTNDSSTDSTIRRDPNDYLVPKINGFTVANGLQIAAMFLAIIVLTPMAIKTLKQFI